jgi:hypothetical protein
MRAITVKAPWTVPILLGVKTVENRRQNTRYRGPLAIHVSRTCCPIGYADARMVAFASTANLPTNRPTRNLALFPGALVALAELVNCHRADGGCCQPGWGEPDAWHLLLRHVTPLAGPVPARGALGVWPVTAELEHAITAASVAGARACLNQPKEA